MYKDQVRHEETRFRILTEVSQQITSILDINVLLEQVVRLIQKTFNYYHVGIGLIEGDDVVYRLGAGSLWDNPDFQFKPARLKLGSQGLTGWVAATGEAALVPDVTQDARYVWMQGSQTRSELTVPIIVKGMVIGVLDVQSERLNNFDQADVELLQSLANQTGIAIENARLFTETQHLLKQTEKRNIELASINSLQLGLASKLDIKGIYELVGEKLRGIFGIHNIVIYTFDHENQQVLKEYAVERGIRHDIPPQKMTPLHKEIIQTGETLFIQENAKEFFEQKHHIMPAGEMPLSFIVVPFKSQGQVAGMIGLFDIEKEFAFKESDVRLMETLTNSMVVALESARLFALTQHLLKETEQRANELALINSVQQGLASKLDTQSIFDLVGETFRTIFDAEVVMISTYDLQTNTVEHRYAIERGERVYSVGPRPPGGFRSQIIQTRQPFMLNTHVAEEAARLGQPTLPGTITPKSWLGVPILDGDQVTGILSVQNVDHENAFTEADVRLLQTFSASMSIALENARLYEQSKQLAVLEERQRMGRELHDSVAQSLYGINLYAEAAVGQLDLGQNEQVRQYLSDIQNTTQESLVEMRLLIYELRPPILEQDGLVAALQNRLYAVENRAGLKFDIQSDLKQRLPTPVEEGMYRIAHEALNNILKHAHATQIQVNLKQDATSVSMEILDNGVGFDPATAHREGCLGMTSMQERALAHGWGFSVDSSPGRGTRVHVEVTL